MTKSKVKCPRCFSDDLYKFGKDKYGNQKYQCKRCYRQFAPETLNKNLLKLENIQCSNGLNRLMKSIFL